MLSSLLALIERLSLFTTAATAVLSLSLLERANRKMSTMSAAMLWSLGLLFLLLYALLLLRRHPDLLLLTSFL